MLSFRQPSIGRGAWLAWSHAWCHVGVLERRKSIAARLLDFRAAGELTIVDDELDDISAIVEIVQQVKDAGLLACVGVDPAGLGEFIEAMAEIGVTQDDKLLVGVPQGYGLMNLKHWTAIKYNNINNLSRLRVALLHSRGGDVWCRLSP